MVFPVIQATRPYLSAVLLFLPPIVITQMMLDLCVKVECLEHFYIKCFIHCVLAAPCLEGVMELRTLFDGGLSSTTSGLVSICVNGVRSLICDSNWDFISARIVCESLGYSPYG